MRYCRSAHSAHTGLRWWCVRSVWCRGSRQNLTTRSCMATMKLPHFGLNERFFCLCNIKGRANPITCRESTQEGSYIALPIITPLNAELNPICYLLALLAHHFLHVSRIRVKSSTLRLLMSYIYIYMEHLFLMFLDHTQRRSTVGRTPLDE